MKLRYSPASPFARKVAIAGRVLGFADRIEMIDADGDPGDVVRSRNPLNKIPLLLTDEGMAIFDSRVIVEYLDHLAGGHRLLPAAPQARFQALTQQALADGIMEASILVIYEDRWREPAQISQKWLAHQQKKVDQGLAALEADLPGETIDVGTIAVASALGFLDLRHGGVWRHAQPKLATWLAGFAARVPAYGETAA